jgi:hypothetical protein
MVNIQYSLVQERLSLAKRILEQGEKLRDPSLLQQESDGWTHPYIQHDALVNYLLLTCFDILGQPNEWLPFNVWLEASKTKHEREEAAALIISSATPIEIAQEMYTAYQKKYGVKASFYRFIDEILDDKTRERLLFSVNIEQRTEDKKSATIDNPSKKKLFLYESRNLFTHSSIPTGSPSRGLWPETIIVRDGKLLWGYHSVRVKNSYFYHVRRWPFELFEIVSCAIGKPIEIYEFDIECQAWFELESDENFVIGNINFSDLRDLNRLVGRTRKPG